DQEGISRSEHRGLLVELDLDNTTAHHDQFGALVDGGGGPTLPRSETDQESPESGVGIVEKRDNTATGRYPVASGEHISLAGLVIEHLVDGDAEGFAQGEERLEIEAAMSRL